jgi:serine/threonine protein kinase
MLREWRVSWDGRYLMATSPSLGRLAHWQPGSTCCIGWAEPQVVTMFDLGTTSDGRPFIVMDYLEGESPDQRIAVGALVVVVPEVVSILMEVCSVPSAVHAKNHADRYQAADEMHDELAVLKL